MQLGGIYCTSRRSPCKFNDEHIMDENQRASVATEFVSNLSKIIDVLSDASIDAGAHVRETFNPPPVLAERKRMSTFSRTTRSKPPPSARRLWCVMSASRWRSSFAMLEQLPGKLPLFLRRKGGVEGREGVRFAVAGEVALRGGAYSPRRRLDAHRRRLHRPAGYTEMPRGGHFTALEQPREFAEDLAAFAESL